jgi:topoisomerase-4 subunit A
MSEVPEMNRGKGVRLQSFKDGGLADAATFAKADGFSWRDGSGRQMQHADWKDWVGRRAQSGRIAPKGFNRNGRFTG